MIANIALAIRWVFLMAWLVCFGVVALLPLIAILWVAGSRESFAQSNLKTTGPILIPTMAIDSSKRE